MIIKLRKVVNMKNTPKRKQRNKPGVVLFTAVAVMLMLSILLTATVSFVSVNRTKTMITIRANRLI